MEKARSSRFFRPLDVRGSRLVGFLARNGTFLTNITHDPRTIHIRTKKGSDTMRRVLSLIRYSMLIIAPFSYFPLSFLNFFSVLAFYALVNRKLSRISFIITRKSNGQNRLYRLRNNGKL